ncbi:MAG: hypothetical protein CL607_06780 [Anaerolineaceae bacterium]|nr:hypothetical protein [Anaerolineaceae bacterium]
MSNQIAIIDVAEGFRFALTETFESVRGMYLDKGTSLFETLAGISAEQASMPISDNCATIAAQVDHTRFYLDVMHESLVKREYVQGSDWAHIWNTVSTVDALQWQAIVNNLRASYDQVVADLNTHASWTDALELSCMLGMIVHSAYHLGEIRQALCFISYQQAQQG